MSWHTSTWTSVSLTSLTFFSRGLLTQAVQVGPPALTRTVADEFCPARSGVAGSVYDLAASPSLADLLKNVSAQVPDPDREGKSLADPKGDQQRVGDDEEKLKVLDVAALGSGSGSSRNFVYMASLPEGSRLWLPAADGVFLRMNRLHSLSAATRARFRQLWDASRTQRPGCDTFHSIAPSLDAPLTETALHTVYHYHVSSPSSSSSRARTGNADVYRAARSPTLIRSIGSQPTATRRTSATLRSLACWG